MKNKYGNKNKPVGHKVPKPIKDGTGVFENMNNDLIREAPTKEQIEHTKKMNDLETLKKHSLTEKQREAMSEFERRLKATEEQLGALEDEEEPQEKNEFAELSHAELLEKGKSKGYPTELDRNEFEKRVKKHLKTAEGILTGEIESAFYTKAKNYAEKSSKPNITRIALAFDKMTPPKGYFGYKGVEYASLVLQTYLRQKLLETQKKTPWMKKFIIAPIVFELAVIPEILARLIAQDQNVSYEQACEILEESTPYGERVFHAGDKIDPDSSSDDADLALSDSDDDMRLTVIKEKPPPPKKQKTQQSTNSILLDDDDDDDPLVISD